MREFFITIVLLSILAGNLPGQAKQSTKANKTSPNPQGQPSATFIDNTRPNARTDGSQKNHPHWYASPEWWLVIVAVPTLILIWYQARETARAAKVTKIAAEATKSQVGAMIASERAWIDGELAISQGLGIYRYTLKARNLGRTPGQIYSYRISPALYNDQFSPDTLVEHQISNLYIFLGSGEERPLRQDFDMDEFFPGDAGRGMQRAFCVTITYADIVTGTPKQRVEHKTSFVYLYNPLLRSIERLRPYNEYS